MKQKALSAWLKGIILGLAVCGLIACAVIIPACGKSLVASYPEFSNRYWPWLFFIWLACVPCFAALGLGWRIAGRIGMDRSFTQKNADALKWIAWLAAGDAGFIFAGNILFVLLDLSHPGVALFSLMIVFVGVAIAIAAAALSHLTQKAAQLQEQSDLTI